MCHLTRWCCILTVGTATMRMLNTLDFFFVFFGNSFPLNIVNVFLFTDTERSDSSNYAKISRVEQFTLLQKDIGFANAQANLTVSSETLQTYWILALVYRIKLHWSSPTVPQSNPLNANTHQGLESRAVFKKHHQNTTIKNLKTKWTVGFLTFQQSLN